MRKIVFLIHGLGDTAALFRRLRVCLESSGWTVYAIDLVPNDGGVGLDELAGRVADRIDRELIRGEPINLVGFSMGGLVARFYAQKLAAGRTVKRLITISTPHQGTWIAFLRGNIGARQMRPRSEFLKQLNTPVALEALRRTDFTSIWTPLDLMIVPADSSALTCARCVRVNVVAHALMMRSRRVLELVEHTLEASCRA